MAPNENPEGPDSVSQSPESAQDAGGRTEPGIGPLNPYVHDVPDPGAPRGNRPTGHPASPEPEGDPEVVAEETPPPPQPSPSTEGLRLEMDSEDAPSQSSPGDDRGEPATPEPGIGPLVGSETVASEETPASPEPEGDPEVVAEATPQSSGSQPEDSETPVAEETPPPPQPSPLHRGIATGDGFGGCPLAVVPWGWPRRLTRAGSDDATDPRPHAFAGTCRTGRFNSAVAQQPAEQPVGGAAEERAAEEGQTGEEGRKEISFRLVTPTVASEAEDLEGLVRLVCLGSAFGRRRDRCHPHLEAYLRRR